MGVIYISVRDDDTQAAKTELTMKQMMRCFMLPGSSGVVVSLSMHTVRPDKYEAPATLTLSGGIAVWRRLMASRFVIGSQGAWSVRVDVV
jgi:hypothetical protein